MINFNQRLKKMWSSFWSVILIFCLHTAFCSPANSKVTTLVVLAISSGENNLTPSKEQKKKTCDICFWSVFDFFTHCFSFNGKLRPWSFSFLFVCFFFRKSLKVSKNLITADVFSYIMMHLWMHFGIIFLSSIVIYLLEVTSMALSKCKRENGGKKTWTISNFESGI